MPDAYAAVLVATLAFFAVDVHANDVSARAPSAVVVFGGHLFQAKALSSDSSISCASCHEATRGFADSRPQAMGVGGAQGTRNVPSLLDSAQQQSLFWDGRRERLEDLVLDPLLSPREHGLKDTTDLERRVADDPRLRKEYAHVFGAGHHIDATHLMQALTAFVATLQSAPSPFDRYRGGQGKQALNPLQATGFELFRGRAGCVACHRIDEKSDVPATFTDQAFHNQGIGADLLKNDLQTTVARGLALRQDELGQAIQADPIVAALGRFLVTHATADIGAFRTPSLRNVALTAPYMHDGSIATLRDAVDHELYYSAVDRGAGFSHEEREALVEFLRALSPRE